MFGLQGKRIAVIGVGNIGRILLTRLVVAGVLADNLVICDSDENRAQRASRRFGPHACSLTDETLCTADVFLLATPPRAITEILEKLAPCLHPGQIVISFAAAVPLSRLEAVVPSGVAVVRIMPNASSLVGQGMNPVTYSSEVMPKVRRLVTSVLQTLGKTVDVKDEQMNWCVGLTGAAMRSLLPALEGLTQAGVEAGFAEGDARLIAAQVMLGTAALALQSDLSFDEIKMLTPMETVDEASLRQVLTDAARVAKEKMDRLQQKIEA